MFTLALPSASLDLGAVAHDGGGKPRIIGGAPDKELFKDSTYHLQVL
jgi:hypothetical protein